MSPADSYPDEADWLGPPPPEGLQFCWPWQQRVSDEVDG